MIEERLNNIDNLKEKYIILERTEVIRDIDFLRNIIKSKTILQSENDFSDSTREEIIEWFYKLSIADNLVKIYWHSISEGISTEFETFVGNFDEIWYPSSDDVWITGNTKSWLIQIDHEEKFSFFDL